MSFDLAIVVANGKAAAAVRRIFSARFRSAIAQMREIPHE
jgi:hypothetical protein